MSTMITGQERPWESVWQRRPARVGYMGVSALDVAVGINRKQGVMDGLKEWGIKDVVTLPGITLCQRNPHG